MIGFIWHIPSVEIFCNFIEQKYERLDILINNAAQTVRRPGFYTHLMANEEPDKCLTKAYTGYLLDHAACLQELKVLTTGASSNQNMPVTWRTGTWDWFGPQIIPDSV
jgi:hypothetical protein